MCSRSDDMTAPENRDSVPPELPSRPDSHAVEVAPGTFLHHGLYLRGATPEPPAEVWCCECTDPSVIMVDGMPYCQKHSVVPLALEAHRQKYGSVVL